MINREKLLAALTHRTLRGKEIFGSGFVSDEWISSKILRAIDRLRVSIHRPADQTAAFLGRGFAGVRDDFVELARCELNVQSE